MNIRFTFQQLAIAAAFLAIVSAGSTQARQAAIPTNTAHAVALPVTAATPQPVAARAAAIGEEESAAASAGGGIKIHGHWLLQVKNPDGKIVDKREFDNSLVTTSNCTPGATSCGYLSGDQLIAALLSGDLTSGGFGVGLVTGSTSGQDPTTFCIIDAPEISFEAPGTQCSGLVDANTVLYGWPGDNPDANNIGFSGGYQTGLTTSVTFAPQVSIVLSGNFTVGCSLPFASGATQLVCGASMAPITAVVSMMGGCGNATNVFGNSLNKEYNGTFANTPFSGANQPGLQVSVPATACTAAAQSSPTNPVAVVMGTLTSTNVPNGPLTVTTGQIITVVVTLSFS